MEYVRRCTVCGKIYCYTDQDLKNNQENAIAGAVSAIGTIASIFGGTAYHTFELNKMSDRSLDKIIDYDKCPNCGSSSTVILTGDELEKYRDNEPAETTTNSQTITINTNASPESLVERGMLFLEDQEWDKANVYFENALDADPKNVRAYLGKLLVDIHISKVESLESYEKDFTDNPNYKKALRFSTEEEKEQLESINKERIYKIAKEVSKTDLQGAIELLDPIKDYKNTSQLIASYSEIIKLNIYKTALSVKESESISDLTEAAGQLEKLGDYREAKKIVTEYHSRIKELEAEEEKRQQEKREQEYETAVSLYKKARDLSDYEKARTALQEMNGYKDCNNLLVESQKEIERLTEIKQQEEARDAIIKAKKKKRTIGTMGAITVVCVVVLVLVIKVIIPNIKYNNAVAMMEKGEYESALAKFETLGSYKDSQAKSEEAQKAIWYNTGLSSLESDDFSNAVVMLEKAGSFQDAESKLTEAKTKLEEQRQKEREAKIEETYLKALDLINNENYDSAYQLLNGIDGYKDVGSLLSNFYYVPYEVFYKSSYSWDYDFEFSDNGLMTKCTIQYSNGDIETFDFDQNGALSTKIDSYGNIHTFRYESDRVHETSARTDGTVYSESIYDQYGNILVLNTLKENLNKERKWILDEHNNIYSQSIVNSYDSDGNLIEVKVDINNLHRRSTFKYKLIYNNSAPENYEEILWRNIRLVCGEDVWQ